MLRTLACAVVLVLAASGCANGPSCGTAGEGCTPEADCCLELFCRGGQCTSGPGAACASGAECVFGACESGLCCARVGEPCDATLPGATCCCDGFIEVEGFCKSLAGSLCVRSSDCVSGLTCVMGICS